MGRIIIANWKMNPQTADEAVELAKAFDEEGVVIAAPFVFLGAVGAVIKKAVLGAQDLSWEDRGAFTGEVSGSQLKDLGVKYVIIGHSERRALGETDEWVAKKVNAALKHRFIPVICVGETRSEHDAGLTESVIEKQLVAAFSLIDRKGPVSNIVVTYEPVWAISKGDPNTPTDTPENAARMIKSLREVLRKIGFTKQLRFIYGGNVNGNNAEGFFKENDIEGALVGGASLRKDEFKRIIDIANRR